MADGGLQYGRSDAGKGLFEHSAHSAHGKPIRLPHGVMIDEWTRFRVAKYHTILAVERFGGAFQYLCSWFTCDVFLLIVSWVIDSLRSGPYRYVHFCSSAGYVPPIC
jgi:hypothetical protein